MSGAMVPAAEGSYPERWGEGVPWGDPSWYRGYKSPYYKPTHHAWRAKVRPNPSPPPPRPRPAPAPAGAPGGTLRWH